MSRAKKKSLKGVIFNVLLIYQPRIAVHFIIKNTRWITTNASIWLMFIAEAWNSALNKVLRI